MKEEIEEQIAEEHPGIIINGQMIKKKTMGVSYFHTVQSFVQFLWNWNLKGGKLVDQNTANVRASICVACHNNKPSSEVRKGGCGTCNKMGNKAIDAVRDKIVKTNKTPTDPRLLACGICGCDLKISVWIPNNILLQPKEANAYPAFCWKKKVLEGTDL